MLGCKHLVMVLSRCGITKPLAGTIRVREEAITLPEYTIPPSLLYHHTIVIVTIYTMRKMPTTLFLLLEKLPRYRHYLTIIIPLHNILQIQCFILLCTAMSCRIVILIVLHTILLKYHDNFVYYLGVFY